MTDRFGVAFRRIRVEQVRDGATQVDPDRQPVAQRDVVIGDGAHVVAVETPIVESDHAFLWKDGRLTDLGTLPGGQSSFGYLANDNGVIVGSSQIGSIDPLTGVRELRGVIWRDARASELGTLGGNSSDPFAVNNRDEAVGAATNGTPDPFVDVVMGACRSDSTATCDTFAFSVHFTPTTTETHAFLWRHGAIQDLGTLGGPDSTAEVINGRGDVAGYSYTSFTPNASSGTPTVDAFYWTQDEGMIDIGGLGGTFSSPILAGALGAAIIDSAANPVISVRPEPTTDLFAQIATVFEHPRCMNCHTGEEFPRQGDDAHRHHLNVSRGPADSGSPGLHCSTCHQATNQNLSGVPGAPSWQLAPRRMAWVGLSIGGLCRSLLDPARGGMKADQFVPHFNTGLVRWAWDPGADSQGHPRARPPLTHQVLIEIPRFRTQ